MTPLGIVVSSVVLGVGLGIAWGGIAALFRVRWNNWQSADSGYEPCEDDCPAPDVTRMIADLRELGFVVRGHWRHTGHSIASGQIMLLEHAQTLDVAKVLVVTAGTRRRLTLVFQTRFEDGTEVVTANKQVTAGLPSVPGITPVWLPEVRDARRLGHVHNQVRDSLGAGKRRLPVGQDATAYLTAGRDRTRAHLVEAGYYSFDEAHGAYRPTWKGAALMTLRLLWPIRPVYRAWRRRRTRKLLRELSVDLDPDRTQSVVGR
jgi:hypothetical protein